MWALQGSNPCRGINLVKIAGPKHHQSMANTPESVGCRLLYRAGPKPIHDFVNTLSVAVVKLNAGVVRAKEVSWNANGKDRTSRFWTVPARRQAPCGGEH